MEIGSFIGLDLKNTGEFYNGDANIARLNSARAGIYHSCRLYNCSSIYIPYYLCPTVKRFLLNHGIEVIPYFINDSFEPIDFKQKKNHAVLLVNYFGILASDKIMELARRYKNVIIDNSAAFYSYHSEGCYQVYSPRKFFGVPDGCYVTGNKADMYIDGYGQDFSSPTASFLFKRMEYGTSETYGERMRNEERIDHSEILRMSSLTRSLLSNIDYKFVRERRQKNFQYTHNLFREMNLIDPSKYIDRESVPMVYPLVIQDPELTDKLKKSQIYTGRWWNHVLSEVSDNTFESWLSRYMIPIPIDQRYDEQIIKHVYDVMVNLDNYTRNR